MAPTALPLYRRNTDRAGPPLVFVHGIKGSRLVDPGGTTRWLTGSTALGFHTPDLQLPLRWSGDRQEEDGLIATEPLTTVDVVPGLVRSNVYGPWLRRAEALGRPLYAFAYDWRRANLESEAKLLASLVAVRERHGGERLQLVAHSMGGLISLPLVTAHPDWFLHVVFAGVPFGGAVGFLEDMHVGLATGVNRRVLSPEVLFTFPSTYNLFPVGRSGCTDANGRELPVDFFSVEDWVEHGLGVFATPGSATEERLRFLPRALARARALQERLCYREQPYPRITVLAARDFPTVVVAVKDGPRSVRGWDLRSGPRGAGDGRVAFEHMMPPRGFEYDVLLTSLPHAALLNAGMLPPLLRSAASMPEAP